MKVFKIVSVILLLLICIGAVLVYVILKSTVPDISGEILTDEVKAPVSIIRDEYGVPHIFGENEHDVFFAAGYAMAQDRLWQMDIMRRVAYGRLSEIFGESTLEDDRFLRTIFAPKSSLDFYNELPPGAKEMSDAFVSGINFYLESTDDRPPLEFLLLGYKPDPFNPEDVVAMNMVMAFALNRSMGVEILRARLSEIISDEKLEEVFGYYPAGSGMIFPDFKVEKSLFEDTLFSRISDLDGLLPTYHLPASNAWAVSGKLTKSGRAILADDSHLSLEIPNSYYQLELSCPEFTIHGGAISGTPLVVEGHTDFFGWGLPTGVADPSDFYIERLNPEDANQYLYDGKWRDMKVKKETIKVKGGDPIEIEIKMTHHGPVISDISDLSVPKKNDEVVTLCWTAHEKLGGADAFYGIMKAKNWKEFGRAARKMISPCLTFVYADADGNIGVWAGMGIPIRSSFSGMKPLPGWDSRYEWKGYVPEDELPFSLNPESGYVAASHNRMVGDDYPYYISSFWSVPDRFDRISEMIETGAGEIDFDYMANMQMDVTSLIARRIAPALLDTLDSKELSDIYVDAKEELKKWDYYADKDSIAASIFFIFYEKLLHEIYEDETGEKFFGKFIHDFAVSGNATYGIFERGGESLWVDDINTEEVEDLDDLLVNAFTDAVDYLRDNYSTDKDNWRWGEVKPLIFYHPIGKELGIFGGFLNDGPYEIGGSHGTVNCAKYPMDGERIVNHGAVLRFIIDYSDSKNWVFIEPPGNSGNFMSPFYKDQSDKWLNGKYNPILLKKEEVNKHAVGAIVIKPVN